MNLDSAIDESTQAVSLICIGMGTVLVFLCLTIFAMIVMSAVVKKLNEYYPEAVPAKAAPARKPTAAAEDDQVALAVLMAVLRHGKK